jgi:diacylglycerol O-acyltransferase / wax synthase
MRRMRGQDAAFLYGETPEWHMQVAALMVIDPADAPPPGYSYERLRNLLVERLPSLPQLRWKVVDVPFGLDRPGWVEDDDFDPDFHIRRIAVPSPGGQAELLELAGRLIGYKLDRRKPLWEVWVVEGLEGGRVATVTKMHHAIVDGVSGAGLAEVMLDLEPEPRAAPTEVHLSLHDTRRPGDLELLARGVFNTVVRTPYRLTRLSRQLVRQGVAMLPYLRGERATPQPFAAPRCALNTAITPHRALGTSSIDLERVKRLKHELDVKVNDVVLGLCATALRRWLISIDGLPSSPLVAQCPVSLHTDADRGEVGNKVGNMFASLATNVDDPVLRVQAIAASTANSKALRAALSAHQIQGLTDTTPPALIGLAARGFSLARLGRATPPPVNVVISNVPGPPFPLYTAGARLERMHPIGPLMMGMAMNITVISYCGSLDFGIVTCPEAIPHPQLIADLVAEAADELEAELGLGAA